MSKIFKIYESWIQNSNMSIYLDTLILETFDIIISIQYLNLKN